MRQLQLGTIVGTVGTIVGTVGTIVGTVGTIVGTVEKAYRPLLEHYLANAFKASHDSKGR
jgi:hypothetical protein